MLNAEPMMYSTFNIYVVARKGFEPLQTVPKTVVLPLDDRAFSSNYDAKIRYYLQYSKKT